MKRMAMAAVLTALVFLVPAAHASHLPKCEGVVYNQVSSPHGIYTEVYEYTRVLVPGYFAYRTIIVGYEYDFYGNAYPVTRTDRVWVPGYWECQWVLVGIR